MSKSQKSKLIDALDRFSKTGKYKGVAYRNYFTLARALTKDLDLKVSSSLISQYYRGYKINPKVSGVGKVIKNKKNKFGIDVEKPRDITLINDKIRDKIKKFKTLDPIQKAVRESNYLHTLSYTPAWKKDLTGNLLAVRRRTKIEYCKTVNTANKRLKELKINHVIFSKTCKL